MNKKVYRFMERFWLFTAIFATVFTTYIVISEGFAGFKFYALLTGLAWGIYFIRKGMRKKVEKMLAEQQNKKSKKNKS